MLLSKLGTVLGVSWILVTLGGFAHADALEPNLLVGRWEGPASGVRGESGRVLEIDSFQMVGNPGTAVGRWGVKGRGLGEVAITVTVTDDTVWAELISKGVGSHISLKLSKDGQSLRGTISGVGDGRPIDVTLKRQP
jgi:hypothetical protein